MVQLGIIAPIESKIVATTAYNEPQSGTARSKYYKLNTGCLLYYELKSLILKAEIMEQSELVEVLKKKAGNLKLLLLTVEFVVPTNRTPASVNCELFTVTLKLFASISSP